MGLFNAKQYNPLAQQMGANIYQQGQQQQMQARGPWAGLAAALSQVMGGVMMGRQNKAEKRDRSSVTEALKEAQGMKRATEKLAPGAAAFASAVPGMEGMEAGDPVGWAETQQEFNQRKQKKILSTLLDSNIPEYKKMGEDMLVQSMTSMNPEFDFKVVKGKLFRTSKKTGEAVVVGNADGTTVDSWNTEDNAIIGHPDGTREFVPGVKSADDTRITHKMETYVDDKGVARERPYVLAEVPGQPGQFQRIDPIGEFGGLAGKQTFEGLIPTDAVTRRKIENELMLHKTNLGNLGKIGELIEGVDLPDHLGFKGWVKSGMTRAMDWLAPGMLTKEQRDYLSTNTEFRVRVRDYQNKYIRAITGAVMNANEIDRIMGALVHPGLGVTEFDARLNTLYSMGKEAESRYEQYLIESSGNTAEAKKKMADWIWGAYGDSSVVPSWRGGDVTATPDYGQSTQEALSNDSDSAYLREQMGEK